MKHPSLPSGTQGPSPKGRLNIEWNPSFVALGTLGSLGCLVALIDERRAAAKRRWEAWKRLHPWEQWIRTQLAAAALAGARALERLATWFKDADGSLEQGYAGETPKADAP